jgi:ATP-dependent DNA ligase
MLATQTGDSFEWAAVRMVNDPDWGLDIKVDGRRLLVDLNGEPVGYNRAGDRAPIPSGIDQELQRAGKANLHLDGELVGTTLWVFDMVGPSVPDVWGIRRLALDNLLLYRWQPDPAFVRAVLWAVDVEGKAALVRRVREEGLEGLIAKRLDSRYEPGKRSTGWRKLKDVKTVDCVVTRLGVDGKKNMAVALWRDGELVEVGEVSALTGDGPSALPGDVVEVTFLYLGANNRLVQPVTPKIRLDKKPGECTWNQLPPAPGALA